MAATSLVLLQLVMVMVPLLLLEPVPAQGTLFIRQLINSSPGIRVRDVDGVAVLGLSIAPTVSHGFRCFTSTGSPSDLMWVKGGSPVRFAVSTTTSYVEMDMSSSPVTAADEGIYNCTNSDGSENIAVYISTDTLAIVSAQPQYSVREGAAVTMAVKTVAFSDLGSEVVQWSLAGSVRGSGENLTISSAVIQDSGQYIVNYSKIEAGTPFTVSTIISLTVQVLPQVVLSPVSMTTSEHSRVVLMCEFTGSPRPLNLMWKKREGNLPIMLRRDITTTFLDNDTVPLFNVRSELVIFNTSVQDSGDYACQVNSPVSSDTVSTEYGRLTVTHGISLSATVGSQSERLLDATNRLLSVADSTAIEIKCNGTGTLQWNSSTGHSIPPFNPSGSNPVLYQRRDSSFNSQYLVIQSFSPSLRAVYTCFTQTPDNIVLQEAVYITSDDLDVYIPVGVVYVSLGDTVDLRASVVSQSPPQWTFNNRLIGLSTPSSNSSTPYYSRPANTSNLRVHNVDKSVLGEYKVRVIDGGSTRQGTVTLALIEPPRVATRPNAASVWEGVGVVLECEVTSRRRRETVVRWSRCGQMPLPLNVNQSGDSLVISSVARVHAGCYECTAISGDVSSSNTTELTVLYGPTSSVVYNNTLISLDTVTGELSLEVEEGSPTHLLACRGAGLPVPNTTWYRMGGSMALRKTSWVAAFRYMDSGAVVCVADNGRNKSRSTLYLTVTRRAVLTTAFPVPPSSTSSDSSFFIPRTHTGPAITCVGTGWPRPLLSWQRHDGMVYGSRPPMSPLDATVTTTLEWNQMSLEMDGVEVSCDISGRGNKSHLFRIDTVSQTTSQPSSPCVVGDSEMDFQLRLINLSSVLCQQPDVGSTYRRQLQVVLVTVIESVCEECGRVEESEVMVTTLTCSKLAQSVVFKGQIATATTDRTRSMVCALSEWRRLRPLVFLEESFHEVDQNCSVITPTSDTLSSSDGHCSVATMPVALSTIIIPIVITVGALVFLLTLVVVVVSICCSERSRRRLPSTLQLDLSDKNGKIDSNKYDSTELSSIDKQPV